MEEKRGKKTEEREGRMVDKPCVINANSDCDAALESKLDCIGEEVG